MDRSSSNEADLRDALRALEEGYRDQPPVIQRQDLEEINTIRSRLGMPLVDGRLVELGAVDEPPAPEPVVRPRAEDPHREAREIYQRYLRRESELERHRRYADEVARATAGEGMTPVRPLATMGTGGGPLLCDHCKKPIPLEGAPYHGKPAHLAWRERPDPPDDWASWILGGLVVEIETNHTLRIYHGYPHPPTACCGKAAADDEQARRAFDSSAWFAKEGIVADFVREELLPDGDAREQETLAHRILDLLFGYDPGVGINRP